MGAKEMQWPLLPKMSWAHLVHPAEPAAGSAPTVTAGAGVTVTSLPELPAPADNLDAALRSLPATRIDVPANWRGTAPITITGDAANSATVLVTVGADAQVHLRETWRGTNAGQLHLLVLLQLAAGAQVRYDTLDLQSGDVAIYRRAELADGAELTWHGAVFGDCRGGLQHAVNLVGTGSRAKANLAVLSGNAAKLVATTTVTNYGRHTQGLINQHGVLTDHAQLVLNGIGAIVRDAAGSDAQQENRVLMLSDHALGEANPLLLIDENDVTAGHAASVAAVDAKQLYYLMSRGLSRAVAVRLVVRGFLLSLLPDDLPAADVQQVHQAIAAQLDGGKIFDGK